MKAFYNLDTIYASKTCVIRDFTYWLTECVFRSMLRSSRKLTIQEFSDFLASNSRPLEKKHIDYRRDTILFDPSRYQRAAGPDIGRYRILNFQKEGLRLYISLEEAQIYLDNLKQMSIDLTYEDVLTVVTEYQEVLQRPRKMGMRGQRNFTGKVEYEIRGKLAEQGLANFCRDFGVFFEPFYKLLPRGQLRDEGDFIDFRKSASGRSRILPDELKVAVKSTNGYFPIAIPENEWDWPGGIYICVRPHLEPSFLLRLINKAVGLEDCSLQGKIGWLEVDGWVMKKEIEQNAYIGTRLPGKYHASERDWPRRNYIMHQLQIHGTRADFSLLMDKYLSLA
jgi:hypothetical protein